MAAVKPGAPGTGAGGAGRPGATGARPAAKRPTSAKPAVRPGAVSSGANAAVRSPSASPASGTPAAVKSPPPAPKSRYEYADDDAEETNAGAKPTVDIPSSPGIGRTSSGINVVAPEQVLSDAKNFVRELRTSDKLAFIGAGATVLIAFLPWKETAAEGEVLGFVSLGFAAFLANLVGIGAIVVRVRNSMPRLHPVAPWLVQLGTVCFGIVWCLIFIKVSTDGRPVPALIGNETVAISRPSFGVYLALLMQLLALAGTLMGLKEKPA